MMRRRFSIFVTVLAMATILPWTAEAGPKLSTARVSAPQASLSRAAIARAVPRQVQPRRLGLSVRRLARVARVRAVAVRRTAPKAIGQVPHARAARISQRLRHKDRAVTVQRPKVFNRQLALDTAMGLVRGQLAPSSPDAVTTPMLPGDPPDPFGDVADNSSPAQSTGGVVKGKKILEN